MTHFTDIELQRWRDSGAAEERPRIVEHTASCAACAARYAAAIRNRPLRAEPAADVVDFAAAGHRVANPRRWLAPLAAAAAVLFALVAIPFATRRQSESSDLHLRGGGIRLLAPAGSADGDHLEFVWASSLSSARYRIVVAREDRVIQSADVAGSRWTIPIRLEPGSYSWTVAALDNQGRAVVTSERRTFTIRR